MPSFVNTFPRDSQLGTFNAGVGRVGASFQPAAAGRLVFTERGEFDVKVVRGMLPMRVRLWAGGGEGGVNSDGTGAHNGTGGGGGGYVEGVIPEGLIAYGSTINPYIYPLPGTGPFPFGGYASLQLNDASSMMRATPGCGGTTTVSPGYEGVGGGKVPGFPNYVMDGVLQVVLADGSDGTHGGTGTVGDGGAGAPPLSAPGGLGSYTSSGGNGAAYGGGGGGTRTGGGRHPGAGSGGKLELTWPVDL